MFGPTPTTLDVNFRLLGTPVRIHPSFWIFSAILGFGWQELGFLFLLLWIGCTLVSLLVHEFGHILMGRFYGRPGHVVLYSFGGLAIGDYNLPRHGQRIAVSFAGPAAGLLLYALVWLIDRFALSHIPLQHLVQNPTLTKVLFSTVKMLLWMNLVWNVLNLIPIYPLDGGHISKEVLGAISPGNGLRLALGTSFVLAGLGAIYSFLKTQRGDLPYPPIDPLLPAIFLALMAVENYQLLQQTGRDRWDSW